MMESTNTNFVKQYEPGKNARVELKNCSILDVINSCYFDAGTSLILNDGKIEAMPGIVGEQTDTTPEFSMDLQGRIVLPSLFNTHIHGPESSPAQFPGFRDMRLVKKYEEQQIVKNMAECLAHGITNIRHAGFVADLRVNRVRMEHFSKANMPAPRILQAVVVGATDSYMQEDLPLWLKVLGMPQVDPSQDFAAAVAFPVKATEGQVRDAVDIAIDERRADVIKIGDESFSLIARKPVPLMTQDQLNVLVDQARLRGVQSMMHHSSIESLRRGLKAGVSSLSHVAFDARLTKADVEAFKASGVFCEPTISAFYPAFSWNLAGNHSSGDPELDRLTEFREKTYTYEDIAKQYFVPELMDGVMNGYKSITSGKPKIMGIIDNSGFFRWDSKAANTFENFLLLYENGVPMTTGNDTVAPCTPAMVDLELLMFDHVLKGKPDGKQLSGAEAVKIATINSAQSLGLEEEFGSIEAGKTADLVILDGDPLEDFRLIGSRVAALFMDGVLVINNCGLQLELNRKMSS
jgi:imidazolonepropionase-like amidohydrolase